MSEFDTAPRRPAFERYGWCAPAEIEPECNPIRHAPDCPEDCGLERTAPPVYSRPLSAEVAREWAAKGAYR
jgi:hypothetical protein